MDDYFRRERQAFFANYFPKERTGESVVYIHKKYLRPPPPEGLESENFESKKRADNTEGNPVDKNDKLQQLTNEAGTKSYKTKDNPKPKATNDNVLEQTIKFAKDLVHGISDSAKDKYVYTVRVAKKSKKDKDKLQTDTFSKEINRRKDSYRHSSIKESPHSTIEELHVNQSLACSLSEISIRKQSAREFGNNIKGRNVSQNKRDELIASESLQALATELAGLGQTKIKLHLMDDVDKSLLIKGIQAPIIDAIKDCVKELNEKRSSDVEKVQAIVKSNSSKIDSIINKISCIENKINQTEKRNPVVTRSVGINTKTESKDITLNTTVQPKSTLEELAQDVEEEDSNLSLEDLSERYEKRKVPTTTETVKIKDKNHDSARMNLGSGEEVIPLEAKVAKLVKPARPSTNKIPTRFCWTDATKKM